MQKSATRLQLSMRTLLQIVAALLVTDCIRIGVRLYVEGNTPFALVALGAGVFILRIVVDNVLFYRSGDPRVAHVPDYTMRVALIALDLASYTVCYHMIATLNQSDRWTLHARDLRVIVGDVGLVEFFHFVWCRGWLLTIRCWHRPESIWNERPMLVRWSWLSGGVAAIAAGAFWFRTWSGEVTLGAAAAFAIASGAFTLMYGISLADKYRATVEE